MNCDKMNMGDGCGIEISRAPKADGQPGGLEDFFNPKGKFHLEVWRDGKLHEKHDITNTIMNVGKNALLDSFFRNQAQPSTWYVGLVDNTSFSAFSASDTMSSHAGWIEFTSYDESTRVAWSTSAASSQSITNGTTADFTISATGTLKGIFITSVSTKSGTTGTLWSAGAFSSTVSVADNDVIKVTYTVNA